MIRTGMPYPLLPQAWGLSPQEVDGLTPFDLALLLALREFAEHA